MVWDIQWLKYQSKRGNFCETTKLQTIREGPILIIINIYFSTKFLPSPSHTLWPTKPLQKKAINLIRQILRTWVNASLVDRLIRLTKRTSETFSLCEFMEIIWGSIVERSERLAGDFGNWFINYNVCCKFKKGGQEAEPLFKEQWEIYCLYYTLLLQ